MTRDPTGARLGDAVGRALSAVPLLGPHMHAFDKTIDGLARDPEFLGRQALVAASMAQGFDQALSPRLAKRRGALFGGACKGAVKHSSRKIL